MEHKYPETVAWEKWKSPLPTQAQSETHLLWKSQVCEHN